MKRRSFLSLCGVISLFATPKVRSSVRNPADGPSEEGGGTTQPPSKHPLRAGHEIVQSFDARDWAKDFVAHVRAYPGIPTDEETMTTWFANALMRGYDERGHNQGASQSIRDLERMNHYLLQQLQASVKRESELMGLQIK